MVKEIILIGVGIIIAVIIVKLIVKIKYNIRYRKNEMDTKEMEEKQYEVDTVLNAYKDTYMNIAKDEIKKNYRKRMRSWNLNNSTDEIEIHDIEKFVSAFRPKGSKTGIERAANNASKAMYHVENLMKAHEAAEKAIQDLRNFKVLDAVVVEEDEVAEGNPISALKENGYTLDTKLFKKWVLQIFGSIKSGSIERLQLSKNFMTEDLYNKLEKPIKQFNNDGLDFIVDDLVVDKCNLYEFNKSSDKEELKVLVSASMKEYILQRSTGAVLKGNDKTAFAKKMLLTFVRENSDTEEGFMKACPICGDALDQNELEIEKCTNCENIIIPIRFNWVLSQFETM